MWLGSLFLDFSDAWLTPLGGSLTTKMKWESPNPRTQVAILQRCSWHQALLVTTSDRNDVLDMFLLSHRAPTEGMSLSGSPGWSGDLGE